MSNVDIILAAIKLPVFYVKLFLGFVGAFAICFFSIPTIIKISRRKNLMDEPGVRSSHLRRIPNLGGIAIFYSVAICASAFAYELFDLYKFLFASLIILLYIGVMDDIVVMRAYKKLIAQIIVSVLIVVGSDVRIRSLFGLFGVYELNYIFSVLFTTATFIVLINDFNLIDGIDGLAGGYTVLCSIMFGISYYRLGPPHYPLVILCGVILGAALAFLRYNLSNYRVQKIFMGDTGSMILGFLLAFNAVSFIDIFIDKHTVGGIRYYLESAPVVAVAILILPIVDTLFVIGTRVLSRRHIMEADRNHIHHKMLDLGLSHRRATSYILLYYLFIVGVTYLCRHLPNNLLLLLVVVLGFLGAALPRIIVKARTSLPKN